MIGQHEPGECEQTGAPSPHAPDGHREDQQEKKIEQRPRRQPVALHPFRAEEREDPPSRREMERALQRVGIRPPSGGRKLVAHRGASHSFHREVAAAHLHAFRACLRRAGDELALPADLYRAEIAAFRDIEPPDPLRLSGDPVLPGEAAAILVEPQFLGDSETRRTFLSHAAHSLQQRKFFPGLPRIHRELPPRFRERRLRDIHRRESPHLHHTQLGSRLQGDQLARGDRRSAGRIAEDRGRVGAKRIKTDLPLSRTHLRLHPPGPIDCGGNRRIHRRQFPALRQHRAQILLAAPARHAQLDLRPQP